MKHKKVTETNIVSLVEKEVNIESKIVIFYIKENNKNTVAHCRVFDTIL